MRKLITRLAFLFMLALQQVARAQPVEQSVKIVVAAEHNNWTYKAGGQVKFSVAVLQNGNSLKNVKIYYESGYWTYPEQREKMNN